MPRILAHRGSIVSGHTLKHLVAAGGVACMVAMLRVRAKPEDREGSWVSLTRRVHRPQSRE